MGSTGVTGATRTMGTAGAAGKDRAAGAGAAAGTRRQGTARQRRCVRHRGVGTVGGVVYLLKRLRDTSSSSRMAGSIKHILQKYIYL